MFTIEGAERETQLFFHALASALACSSDGVFVDLELPGERQPSPEAQKQVVAEHLATAMTDVERVLRSQKDPVTRIPRATKARLLVEREECYDAVARTYDPGPGFLLLINTLLAEAEASADTASPSAHVTAAMLDTVSHASPATPADLAETQTGAPKGDLP